jgi:fructose-bisphosphate aldolase class I
VANAHALARDAGLCQEAGLVPVVELEVPMTGDHTLRGQRRSYRPVLHEVFEQLHVQRVLLEGLLLKPNIVLPGLACTQQDTVDEVADATVATNRWSSR